MLSNLVHIYRRVNAAFKDDETYQNSVRISAITASPAAFFVPIFLMLQLDSGSVPRTYEDMCDALRNTDETSALHTKFDYRSVYDCLEDQRGRYEERVQGINNRAFWGSLIGMLLLNLTINHYARASDRMRELEESGFFHDRGL